MNVCNCCEWSCVLESTMHCTAVYDLLLNVTDLFCKQHELRMSRIEGLVLKWILRRRWLFGLDDMKDGGMLTK